MPNPLIKQIEVDGTLYDIKDNVSGYVTSSGVTSITITADSPIKVDSSAAITTTGTRTISHATTGVAAKTTEAVYPIKIDTYGHVTSSGSAVTSMTPSSHSHGYISNAGAISSTTTIATGDKLAIIDNSDSSKVIGSGISFDTSNTGKVLSQAGTWVDLPSGAMTFKGSIGQSGGSGTTATVPTSGVSVGDTYKIIEEDKTISASASATGAAVTAKIGDVIVATASTPKWVVIPSGDEPSGTVTSIVIDATSPIAVSSTAAITTSGTRTISHATSGVTAGSYGPTSAATVTSTGSFTVPQFTVNATGHITSATPIVYSMEGPLTGSTSSVLPAHVAAALNDGRDIYLSHVDGTYGQLYFTNFNEAQVGVDSYVVVSNTIVKMYNEELSIYDLIVYQITGWINNGTWDTTATSLGSFVTEIVPFCLPDPIVTGVSGTGDITVTVNATGNSVTVSHNTSGVTAGGYGPTAGGSLTYGGSFTVPQFTVSSTGHITSATPRVYTLPASDNTDIKQNITLATTSKAFVTGVTTTPTGTAQALTGVADTGVYLTSTSGQLNATTFKVNEAVTMQYNSTSKALDFIFA